MPVSFPPFDAGVLDDTRLRDAVFVRSKFNEAVQAVGVRDSEILRLNTLTTGLQKQFEEANRQVSVRDTQILSLRTELANQATRVTELTDKLTQLSQAVPKIGVQDLVSQFKGNIDRINADVISRKNTGMLVDSVEVEVRGGIDVTDGLHITQLPAAALGETSVSVLRFNLRPASALKIVDDDAR